MIEHRVNSLLHRDQPPASFALAFLDIDNFKHINDYYGHANGDALLIEVAKRLGMDLRESDMLSRISGDEFLLLLNPIQSQQEVTEYIRFTLERLRAPFFIDGSEIFASTSIGVSLYPEHGRSHELLRQNADIAMYTVKNAGKVDMTGRIVVTADGLHRTVTSHSIDAKGKKSTSTAVFDKQ